MDKEGIEFLKKKIVDLYEWMEEGAEGNCSEISLDDIIKGGVDLYEVTGIITLNNGEKIRVQNKCIKSWLAGRYEGDEIECEEGGISISHFDEEKSKIIFYEFPLCSISSIQSYSDDPIWQSEELREAYEEKIKKDKKNNGTGKQH